MKDKVKHPFNIYFEGVDHDLWHSLCEAYGTRRIFHKGERFATEGEPAFYLGFVESGYFKRVVRDFKGREQIIGFSFQNELIGDYLSIVEREPARCEMIAVTRAQVIVCEGEVVHEVMARYPEAQREFSTRIIRQTYQRLIDLYNKSPKERYLEILKSCPEILQQITLKELASYLQITPTYLSRIRTSLLNE